jgi:hypothetical protein
MRATRPHGEDSPVADGTPCETLIVVEIDRYPGKTVPETSGHGAHCPPGLADTNEEVFPHVPT